MEKCLERCLANCRCLSFQLCDGMACQLNFLSKYQKPSALLETKGCVHYNFGEDYTKVNNQQQCGNSCSTGINCCLTSSPCKNGGTCVPSPVLNNKRRFQCKCPDGYRGPRYKPCVTGYTGFQCRVLMTPRSCQAYQYHNRQPDIYTIFDANMNFFKVFCDFDKNSSMSWTLISSYEFQYRNNFNPSFAMDNPINEETPNWKAHRLSKLRVQSIQQDSTKWRITCDYQSAGVIFKDYVRASTDKLDILTYDGRCIGCGIH